jgi:hypothetical protein
MLLVIVTNEGLSHFFHQTKTNLPTNAKFERFFMPSLIVFGLLAFGGFLIIYSITQDMTKLAQSVCALVCVLFHTFQHFLQVRNTGADHDIIVVNGVTLNVFIFFKDECIKTNVGKYARNE